MTLLLFLSFVSFKNLNNDHYVPELGFSTFGTISAVHFHHLSTHVTCITCVHVIYYFCHISSRFSTPETRCLEKCVNSDSQNLAKFNMLARFREMIQTVKFVSSSEI